MNGPFHGLSHVFADRLDRIAEQSGMAREEVREVFEERAAVREYQGNQKRNAAETAALDDVEEMLLPRVKS